jgi:hypothetical protein
MIAYEELVAALASWRQRNGLPTDDGGHAAAASYAAADYAAPSGGYDDGGYETADEVVEEMGDDGIVAEDLDAAPVGLDDPESTSIGASPDDLLASFGDDPGTVDDEPEPR